MSALPPNITVEELIPILMRLVNDPSTPASTVEFVMKQLTERRPGGVFILPRAALAYVNAATADDANAVSQSKAKLQLSRFPVKALSVVFSYLASKQVIQLRRTNQAFNHVGQLQSSFNTSIQVDHQQLLDITRPAAGNYKAIKACQITPTPAMDALINEHASVSRAEQVQKIYTQMLNCIAQSNSSLEVLKSTNCRRLPYFAGYDQPLLLTTLLPHPIANQLRRLHLHFEADQQWKLLTVAQPLLMLEQFAGCFCDAVSTQYDVISIVTKLVPNVRKLQFVLNEVRVQTLAPMLQLKKLQSLLLTSHRQIANDTIRVSAKNATELLGSAAPALKLQHLVLAANDRLHQLLVRDGTNGLAQLAAGVTMLDLDSHEHLMNFSTHLAQLQSLKTLTLTSPKRIAQPTAQYREQLLTALAHLPQLTELNLLLEEEQQSSRQGANTAVSSVEYQRWSGKDLKVLFNHPTLVALTVEHLTSTAGQALATLADGKARSVRRVKLGVTELEFDTIIAGASALEWLLLPPEINMHCSSATGVLPVPRNVQVLLDWHGHTWKTQPTRPMPTN